VKRSTTDGAAMYKNSLSILDISDSALCDYGWKIASDKSDTAVRFVRGNKMRRVDGLFDEISAACQFPYYFGENWPALSDCLGDLDWIASSNFVLIITRFSEVLVDEPSDIGAFVRCLGSAIGKYNKAKGNLDDNHSVFQVVINTTHIDESIIAVLSKEVGSPTVPRT
jgi:hypothetical protein